MSTIHGLQMLAVDLEQRVVREMQFTGDAERQVADAFTTLREAMANVENIVMNTFQERGRALASTLGNGSITPETVESTPPKVSKIRRVETDLNTGEQVIR
jgi:hypothetical protein